MKAIQTSYGHRHHYPVAHVYEAAIHCLGCAWERFGEDEGGFIAGTDREGNEVGALFSWNEGWCGESCGTCGGPLS